LATMVDKKGNHNPTKDLSQERVISAFINQDPTLLGFFVLKIFLIFV